MLGGYLPDRWCVEDNKSLYVKSPSSLVDMEPTDPIYIGNLLSDWQLVEIMFNEDSASISPVYNINTVWQSEDGHFYVHYNDGENVYRAGTSEGLYYGGIWNIDDYPGLIYIFKDNNNKLYIFCRNSHWDIVRKKQPVINWGILH